VSLRARGPALLPGALVLALALALAAGCKRELGPSPDYARARAKLESLTAQFGDDAYVDPEMEEVEKLLARVPPRSSDAPAAAELSRRIASERARVQKERADLAAAPPPAPPADPWASEPRREEPEAAEVAEGAADAGAADAGFPYPVAGMPVAEVRARFSYCFLPAAGVVVDGAAHEIFELRNLPSCRDGFPQFQGQLLAAREGKVVGTLDVSDVQSVTVPVDGGLPR
jgi:hypothetical protein